jgi:predicted alpha/beta superfamily hydrolase
MRWRLLLPTAVLAAGAVLTAVLARPPHRSFKISSRILGESRTVLTYLPRGYDSSGASYPVLVHLDASPLRVALAPSFYETARRINALGGPMPAMMAFGVINTDRSRDMIACPDTGAAAAEGARDFLRFITEELLPAIESRYRAGGMRILYGRSDSGLFALYALAEKPDAFQAVIASSPSLDRCPEFAGERFRRLFRERPDLSQTLFLIYGSNELHVSARVPAFADLIRASSPTGFSLGVSCVPDGGHVPRTSLEEGLRFVAARRGTR